MLRHSFLLTLLLAALGISFGLASGSLAIVFDGIGSSIDAAMTFLSLAVARLIGRDSRRFQFGYWHFEPMVLAFNGGLLILFCLYGFVSAIGDLLAGGRTLDFGWAIAYAGIASTLSLSAYCYERLRNRHVSSELVRLDSFSWLMSATVSGALLLAFAAAIAIADTPFAWTARYVDSAVLAVLSAGLALVPIKMLREAWSDILQIAPTSLDEEVKAVMDAFVARHGLTTYSSYVARYGRATFIELHVVLPSDFALATIATVDGLRREIADSLGPPSQRRWLTIVFTGDAQAI